jgi:FkbM family methyltransferase
MLKYLYGLATRLFLGTGIRRIPIVRKLDDFIVWMIKSDSVIIDGHKLFVDKNDSLRYSCSESYEPFQTEVSKIVLKEGDIAVDIGANIGYYTLLFAKLVGKKGKVIAFEPEPETFTLLKKNVETSRYKNIEIHQKAVSDKEGKVRLYLHRGDLGYNSISKSKGCYKSIEVDAIRVDDYVKKADFIKIDIDGGEEKAMKGMTELLKQPLTMITEFAPRCNPNAQRYLTFLKKHFIFYDINERKKVLKAVKFVNRNTNLLCIKKY